MKYVVLLLTFFFIQSAVAGYDDPSTSNVNEGYIGTGQDDPSTPNINEGAIGQDNRQPVVLLAPKLKPKPQILKDGHLTIIKLTPEQKEKKEKNYWLNLYKSKSPLIPYLRNKDIYDAMDDIDDGIQIFIRKLTIVEMVSDTTAIVSGNDIAYKSSQFNSDPFFVSGLNKGYKKGDVIDGAFMQDPNLGVYKLKQNGKTKELYKLIFVDDQILNSSVEPYIANKKLYSGSFGSLAQFKNNVLPTLKMPK